MSKLEKYQLEYALNSAPNILFNRLSTPSGLSEWFADDVNMRGSIFTFIWNNSEQEAEILSSKTNKFVKYKWVDSPKDTFFEFKINIDDLTGETALIITDFATVEEMEESIDLWNSQINNLKHVLGI